MVPITDFPRCAAYLNGMGIRLADPDMQDRHFAWLLGDAAFSEKELTDMGAAGVESGQWGSLLPAMEDCMVSRGKSKRNTPKLTTQQWNQFKGWMTCYGIKGGAIKGEAATLEVARCLWPELPKSADARRAFELIGRMQKKYRSYVARENLHSVPSKYLVNGDGEAA